jgi:hypothetical protein
MRRASPLNSLVWLAMTAATPACAVTLQQLTMEEMAQKSTAIVYAKVLDSYGAQHGSMIYTHYRIQVLDQWKNGKQSVTEVMLPGGVANGYRQTFAGVPSLEQGKSYLMFLWSGGKGAPQLIGLTQGLFDVSPDGAGILFASRGATTEQLLDANGKTVQDAPMRLELKAMNRRIVAALSPAGPAKGPR